MNINGIYQPFRHQEVMHGGTLLAHDVEPASQCLHLMLNSGQSKRKQTWFSGGKKFPFYGFNMLESKYGSLKIDVS